MAELLLPSLQIRGFRAFQDFSIEKLGRVNLITGRNSVGKTSLLEAVEVYISRAEPQVLRRVLVQRGELRELDSFIRNASVAQLFESMRMLFHGRPRLGSNPVSFSISSENRGQVQVKTGWLARNSDESQLGTYSWADTSLVVV